MTDNAFPQIELGSIATLRQGVSFRSGLRPSVDGVFRVVQARDLEDNGSVSESNVLRTDAAVAKTQMLENGDILFQPRGLSYSAAVITWVKSPTVAAAPLYVITVRRNMGLRSDFLVSFINNATTRARLRSEATGTHVLQLSRGTIAHFQIPIPPVNLQKAIVDAEMLSRRELLLVTELHTSRMLYLHEASLGNVLMREPLDFEDKQ